MLQMLLCELKGNYCKSLVITLKCIEACFTSHNVFPSFSLLYFAGNAVRSELYAALLRDKNIFEKKNFYKERKIYIIKFQEFIS